MEILGGNQYEVCLWLLHQGGSKMKKYRLKKGVKEKAKSLLIGFLVVTAITIKLVCGLFRADGGFVMEHGFEAVFEIYVISDILLGFAILLATIKKEYFYEE